MPKTTSTTITLLEHSKLNQFFKRKCVTGLQDINSVGYIEATNNDNINYGVYTQNLLKSINELWFTFF